MTAVSNVVIAALLAVTPVTPQFPARADQVRQQQWMLDYLQVARAHELSTGEGVIIGLPDTGVDPHPDLKGNLLGGFDLVNGANGQIDVTGHGTSMAGVIAGQGHANGSGVLGIAPSATILPITIASRYGGTVRVAEGIELAVKQGARVVNVSSGGPKTLSMRRAVEAAQQADVLVIAANGNTTQTVAAEYPAAMPGVLAVGAIQKNGRYSNISVTGGNIALCAPGVEVITTGRNSKYVVSTGTSIATAIVSGAAALVRSKFPDLPAQEVLHRLTATADDIGPPGKDDQCGYGVLNIVKALTADVPPLTATTTATPAPSTPAGTTTSAGAAPSGTSPAATSRSYLPLVAALGATAVGAGTILALLAARRRRAKA